METLNDDTARREAAEADDDISLERALAIAGRALPGWLREVSEHRTGKWMGAVSRPDKNPRLASGFHYAYEASPGLAICSAVLKATVSKDYRR